MLLSIITINYNNAIGLQRTLNSVAEQLFCNYEHIIIDGGSTDDSIIVIQNYVLKVLHSTLLFAPKISWLSEKDNGIYDAMNKGIDRAQGEYCLFLNSGDVFAHAHVLEDIVQYGMNADIICGDSIFEASKYHDVRHIVSPNTIRASHLILSFLPHQSSFIKRSLFDEIHRYDTAFKVISDWLFFIEALLLHKVSYQHIPIVVSHCETEGISNNPNNCCLMEEEFERGMKKIMPDFFEDYVELRSFRRESLRPVYKFFKNNEQSLWFKIVWKLHRLKTQYLK